MGLNRENFSSYTHFISNNMKIGKSRISQNFCLLIPLLIEILFTRLVSSWKLHVKYNIYCFFRKLFACLVQTDVCTKKTLCSMYQFIVAIDTMRKINFYSPSFEAPHFQPSRTVMKGAMPFTNIYACRAPPCIFICQKSQRKLLSRFTLVCVNTLTNL